MTYQELLNDLEKAERHTVPLQNYVADKWAAQIEQNWMDADYITKDGDADKIEFASWFIADLEKASWNDTDQDGTANAYDTVADYGVDFDSLVGKFIFADMNCPANA
tara:strand:- start:16 stop:336 length:321 start_codon:yes stop_codon:yes gene_type:complete